MIVLFAGEICVTSHQRGLSECGAWDRLLSYYEVRKTGTTPAEMETYVRDGVTPPKQFRDTNRSRLDTIRRLNLAGRLAAYEAAGDAEC